MNQNHATDIREAPASTVPPLPEYEPPTVTTYTHADILEELGPAQTIYGPVDP
ncbi:MAG TPA: hypothetical protein VGD99_14425 [Anaerolineae bacterium]